jgi:hypothetical protein
MLQQTVHLHHHRPIAPKQLRYRTDSVTWVQRCGLVMIDAMGLIGWGLLAQKQPCGGSGRNLRLAKEQRNSILDNVRLILTNG